MWTGCQKFKKINDVVYRWSPCLLLKCFVVSCLHRLDTLANNQRLLCATECTAILAAAASVDECQSSSRHQHCLVIIITVPSNCVPTAAAPRAADRRRRHITMSMQGFFSLTYSVCHGTTVVLYTIVLAS